MTLFSVYLFQDKTKNAELIFREKWSYNGFLRTFENV